MPSYYYSGAAGQTYGPVEPDALYAAIHEGTLAADTLAVEEGGTEWKPLAALLHYFYSADGEVLDPVRLAELPVFAAAANGGEFIGGAEWVPFGAMHRTPAATPAVYVPAYLPAPIQRAVCDHNFAAPATVIFLTKTGSFQ